MDEESGYQTCVIKLLAVYDINKQHPPFTFYIYKLFFQCELLGGSPSSSIETEEVGFFPENALLELSLGRVLPQQITRFFQHYRQPD